MELEKAPTREEILRAAALLAGVCDGAVMQDDAGYNAADGPTAKSILRAPRKSDRQIRALWMILRKYREQLSGLGVAYEDLVPPREGSREIPALTPSSITVPAAAGSEVRFLSLRAKEGPVVGISFEYDERLVAIVKTLSVSRRFDKQGLIAGVPKTWLIPADPESIRVAIETFQAAGKAVDASAVQEIVARGEKAYSESRAESADLDVPTKLPPYPFQKAAIRWTDERNGRSFLADEPGLGKSPEALGWMALRREKAIPALILCPAAVRVTWLRHVEKFTDFKAMLVAGKSSVPGFKKAGLPAAEEPLQGCEIAVMNYDLLSVESPKTWMKMLIRGKPEETKYASGHLVEAGHQAAPLLQKAMKKNEGLEIRNRLWKVLEAIKGLGKKVRGVRDEEYQKVFINRTPLEDFARMGFRTLVCDESHNLQDMNAQRTQAAIALSKLVAHAMCLSGTPINNRPRDLWPQLQIVDPNIFPSFFNYGREFCAGYQKPTTAGNTAWDFSGASNLEKLEKILRSTALIRRTKDQVASELPPKTRSLIPIIIEPKEEVSYRKKADPGMERLVKMKKEREEWKATLEALPAGERSKFIAQHAEKASRAAKLKGLIIDQIDELKQAAVAVKFDESIRFIKNLHDQGKKILVFAAHHETIDRFVEVMKKDGVKVASIDSRVDGTKRQPIIDAFQEEDLEILICGIRAMSAGVTLTASHTVVKLELDWNPSTHLQAEDRCHRYSQKTAVNIYYLVLMNSLEEKIARLIDGKRELVNSILGEGDRTLSEDGILDAVLAEVVS